MRNAAAFRAKLANGDVAFGTAISFTDATVTEALSDVLDFVWIDMEHGPLSLETVQAHLMATRGSQTAGLVRVAWNDAVLIKPVLDMGADGIIVPMVRTPQEARKAVAACKYPPAGVRGFGPRRASDYARRGGPAFCRESNEEVLTFVQIEHVDAVENLDEILATSGLSGIALGPNDLAASMGHTGEPAHPEVMAAIETTIAKARRAGLFVGIGSGQTPEDLARWIKLGVQWLSMGGDFTLLTSAAAEAIRRTRQRLAGDAGREDASR